MANDNTQSTPIWRDDRFWKVALQVLTVVAVLGVLALLLGNLNRNMQQKGIQFGFNFLRNPANFGIGESLLTYSPSEPYFKALFVGLVNTLRVMLAGIVLTTIVGIAAGIASFSDNWLVRQISWVYVEVVRNTPLLLQLFFWYFAVFFGLPVPEAPIEWLDAIYLSKAGIYLPWPPNTAGSWMWLVVLIVGAIAAVVLWQWRIKLMVDRGESGNPQLYTLIGMGAIALGILVFGWGWQVPRAIAPGQVEGGLRLSLEFSALLAGLVFYTGAFVAEIVRAGIQSVSRGQWDAARSLGLHPGLVMRLVVFPQALRVMIPSLNSQYQNLAKNSSLGFAIAYPEIYSVSNTTYNQTGKPIEVFVLIMVAYLIINTTISLVMNQLNRAVQLKER
jgi:general L-amino acid transport system permease protein